MKLRTWRAALAALLVLLVSQPAFASLGQPGPYGVTMSTYGSWSGGANTTTDVSSYFDSPAYYVSETLGITMDAVPLRAHVYEPSAGGPLPILFILHGNHDPANPSLGGYGYLASHLASYGYIVVEVDQDFLNGASGEMDARAIVLLRHMQLWRQWNQSAGHRWYGMVDMSKIGLIGHSRGGEAVVVAKKLNTLHHQASVPASHYNFSIKALLALAPTDGLIHADFDPTVSPQAVYFADPAHPEDGAKATPLSFSDAAYAVMQGSYDEDVVFFVGNSQYERALPATLANVSHPKAAYWIHGANHKHFNSNWAQPCVSAPQSEACADAWSAPRPLHNLITPAETQQIAKVYATAFMELALRGTHKDIVSRELIDAGLPSTVAVVGRYQDKARVLLDHYQEDANLASGSLAGVSNSASYLAQHQQLHLFPNKGWMFGPVAWGAYPHTYLDTEAAILAWSYTFASYKLSFATTATVGSLVAGHPVLSFDMAQMYEMTPDKNVAGADQDISVSLLVNYYGYPNATTALKLSDYSRLPYPQIVTDKDYYGSEDDYTHTVMSTVRIPLADFVATTPHLKLDQIKGVVFKFNQRSKGRVVVDNIQVSQ